MGAGLLQDHMSMCHMSTILNSRTVMWFTSPKCSLLLVRILRLLPVPSNLDAEYHCRCPHRHRLSPPPGRGNGNLQLLLDSPPSNMTALALPGRTESFGPSWASLGHLQQVKWRSKCSQPSPSVNVHWFWRMFWVTTSQEVLVQNTAIQRPAF